MGKHSKDTPGRKKENPAATGLTILNVASGVLNFATAAVRFVIAILHLGL